MSNIVISGTGLFTPQDFITNEELVDCFNQYVDRHNQFHNGTQVEPLLHSSADFITKASGIKQRYVMEKSGILDVDYMRPRIPERSNEEPSLQCEMAVVAAQEAMERAQISSLDIDAVLVACSNMQRPYPAMSIEIQHALGIEGFAYDLNVACSSATFGIQAAMDAIGRGTAKAVLMVNPEICSAHLNFRDRDSHFIFGDACTAMILQREEDNRNSHAYRILSTQLKTQYSNNIRNNFGFLNVTAPETRYHKDKLFVQQGRKVFKEVVPLVSQHLLDHLEKEKLLASNLKRLWLHQANLNMNQLIAHKVLGRDPQLHESPVILDEYANTSSAGSIIAFHKYHQDLASGAIGIICSFGAGYSVGSVILQKQ
jgi:beta-ketodecanoyl-[acyl-carrier-protein] synthase